MAKRNFKSILLDTSDFNSDEYLDELLLFDFEKSGEENFLIEHLKEYLIMIHIISNIEKEQMLFE